MMFKYMCLVLFITWYQLADCHPAKPDVQSLDSMIEKESEAFLSVEAEQASHKTVRDKRTIGFLRQLFPNLSQIIDRKIQQITRFVFRVIGRLVLRGGAGGGAAAGGANNAGGNTNSGGGRRISITLPTYPPSTDDEDEESSTELSVTEAQVSIDTRTGNLAGLPQPEAPVSTVSPAAAATEAISTDSAPAASADASMAAAVTTNAAASIAITTAIAADSTTVANVPAAAITTTLQPPSDADNSVGTGIVKRTARDVSDESGSTQKRSPLSDTENDVLAPNNADNVVASNADGEDSLADTTEDDPRNKRFLLGSSGTRGSGGGSGNFLFDLIRLVAGSGATQDKDESNVAPVEGEVPETHADLNAKEDGYNVGVPGPLTRIFVIANRGVANLVQDLILRLAQTTERIVNFKARLITSLI